MPSPTHPRPHKTAKALKAKRAVKRASRQRYRAKMKTMRDAIPVAVPAKDILGAPIFTPPVEKLSFLAMLGAFLGIKRSKKERRENPKIDKSI